MPSEYYAVISALHTSPTVLERIAETCKIIRSGWKSRLAERKRRQLKTAVKNFDKFSQKPNTYRDYLLILMKCTNVKNLYMYN